MDRRMVSDANLAFLRERKARYLVGTPKSWLRAHERTLLDQTDWKTVQDGLEVRLVEHPAGEPGERYVLCRSGARAEKERAMLQRQSERLTAELIKIDAWLRRTLRWTPKIGQRGSLSPNSNPNDPDVQETSSA
jgi:hypothetical protein